MADPLNPAGTQTGTSDPYQNMTPEEYQRELDMIMSMPDEALPTVAAPAGTPPRMTGLEEKVWAEGYDPYAASKQEKSSWETAVRKFQDIERWATDGLNPLADGFSPTAIIGDAVDQTLFETGRSLFDVTNSLGITDVATRERGKGWSAGPAEETTAGILSFIASFAGYNKFLKVAGIGSNVLRWGLAGGAADAFGQDPFAEGVADLLKKSEIPGLDDNFVVNYFAAEGNEDDSVWEARFKNAAEGFLVGEIVGKPVEWLGEKLWGVFKNMKTAYKAAEKGEEKAAAEAFETAIEQADEIAKETGQPFFDPEKMEWDSGSFYARRAAQAAPTNAYYDIKSAPPVDPTFNPDSIGALGDISVNTPGPLPIQSGPFRTLEESMQALTQGQAAQDAAAVRVGTEGVDVGQATAEAAGTRQVGDMRAAVYPNDIDSGRPLMSATLPTPTAPRYSAVKPKPAKAAPAAKEGGEQAGKKAAGGKKAGAEIPVSDGATPRAFEAPVRGEPVILSVSKQAAKEFAEAMGKSPEASMEAFDKTFNSARWTTSDEVKEAIGQAADILRQNGVKVDQKLTQKYIQELADAFLENPRVLLAKMRQLGDTSVDMPSLVLATKMAMASVGNRMVKTAAKINAHAEAGMATKELDEMFARDLSMLQGMLPDLTLVRHRAATTTWVGNIQTVSTDIPDEILRAVKQFPGDRKMAQLVIARLAPAKAAEAAKRIMLHKSWDALIQWRTGALLYGPRTMITNIVGTGLWGVTKPSLRVLGSLLMADGKTARENLRVLGAMRSATADSWRMMRKSFVENKGIMDGYNNTYEQNGVAFQALAEGKGDSAQLAAKYLDGVSNLPMRALTAQDEFFKQIAYRSFVTSKGTSIALEGVQKGILKEAEVDDWVENYVKNAFDADGAAIDPEGLQYAREATFTQDMGPWGKRFQEAANAIPPLKLVFPFIRTPTNLISEGIQMFPGANLLSSRYRAALHSTDPAKRAEAVGKMAFGTFVMGTALYYASQGMIIGRAPSDPQMLKTFQESGRLPYSFYDQSSGRWVQFNRLDPYALPFGIAADLAAAYQHEGTDITQAFVAAAIGIGDNLKNKSYLTGISDVADLIGSGFAKDDEARTDQFTRSVGKQVASLVPNFTSQMNPDDTLRETRGILDQTMNRLWMFGGDAGLPPKRDMTGEPIAKNTGWLFGEVPNWMSPFTMALPADSPVKEQLLKAQITFKHPPRKIGNVNLTDFKNAKGQDAYDRFLELTGQVVDEGTGRTLKQELETRVSELQAEYGNIGPQRDEFGEQIKSPIEEEVRRIFGAYRSLAKEQLMQEYPDLAKRLEEDTQRRSPAARQDAAIKALQ
jgi:hypothetical protein